MFFIQLLWCPLGGGWWKMAVHIMWTIAVVSAPQKAPSSRETTLEGCLLYCCWTSASSWCVCVCVALTDNSYWNSYDHIRVIPNPNRIALHNTCTQIKPFPHSVVVYLSQALLILFSVIRRKLWDYGRLALISDREGSVMTSNSIISGWNLRKTI